MMKGLMGDENMSNLTCASGDLTASNSSIRNELSSSGGTNLYSSSSIQTQPQPQPPPPKKKRNLPGNPDPDAEVIALSPKSLMATNRFVCEICNKGFQREQNLQLHRRGHNLPWKLKQRTSKEVRKKVYLCPEVTCVHHDPSRALGDLTGIKKHFCRKHGEKKWKCEKCSKRYAVQSDWKAHSKICGTREYRCDCGTLFSRRDSFITHRAFCDALAQENSGARSAMPASINPLLLSSLPQLHNSHHGLQPLSSVKREQDHHHHHNHNHQNQQQLLPPWLSAEGEGGGGPTGFQSSNNNNFTSSPLFSTSSFQQYYSFDQSQNPNPSSSTATATPATALLPENFQLQPNNITSSASPHMSATALLQKASEMGATVSKPSHSQPFLLKPPNQSHHGHASNEAMENNGFSGNINLAHETKASLLHDMMVMSNNFGDHHQSANNAFNGIMVDGNFVEINNNNNSLKNNDDGLSTRDFLGLRPPFPASAAGSGGGGHGDFFSMHMAGLGHHHHHHVNSSSSNSGYNGQVENDHQNQTSWQG